jgi:rhodanese-related sulfurtransferase
MNPTAAVATAPTSRHDHRISAADAADLLMRHQQGVLPALAVFDVRDAARYAAEHIAGAAHLTDSGFGAVMARLARTTPVLIYCYHGNASRAWAVMFAEFRYPEVYSVDGGYEAFAESLGRRQATYDIAPRARPAPSAALAGFLADHGYAADDLDAPRAHGLTALMRAALEGRAELVAELLAMDVSIARRNMDGNNALWLACVSGQAEAVKLLVQAGIDLDNRNDMGATCLMYTASAGKAAMVALLLTLGADPLLTNFDDARAVDLAATRECLALLRHTAR